ncbi:MAG: PQQ-like beta-propeller repeat protein [Armatimonadetes bacterium]|nr:PQQ-like beta-propeller repeat protein [Armatimonadota bacterium]
MREIATGTSLEKLRHRPLREGPMRKRWVADDDCLRALHRDNGEERWSLEPGARLSGSPTLGPDGTVLQADPSGMIYALAPDGTLRWKTMARRDEGTLECSPSIVGVSSHGAVLIWNKLDRRLYALDASDGRELWTRKGTEDVQAAVSADSLYLAYSPWTAAVSKRRKLLRALDPRTGRTRWKQAFYGEGRLLAEKDRVVIAAEDGTVRAWSPRGKRQWENSTGLKPTRGPVGAADGSLILGDERGRVLFLEARAGSTYRTEDVGGQSLVAPSVGPEMERYLKSRGGSIAGLDEGPPSSSGDEVAGSIQKQAEHVRVGHVFLPIRGAGSQGFEPAAAGKFR